MDNTRSQAQPAPSTTTEASMASPLALQLSLPALQTFTRPAISEGSRAETFELLIQASLTRTKRAMCKRILQAMEKEAAQLVSTLAQSTFEFQSHFKTHSERSHTLENQTGNAVNDSQDLLNAPKEKIHPQSLYNKTTLELQPRDLESVEKTKTAAGYEMEDENGIVVRFLDTLTEEEQRWVLDYPLPENILEVSLDQHIDQFMKFIKVKLAARELRLDEMSNRDLANIIDYSYNQSRAS
ncbi:hypothetical protein EV361DRAFT_873749 [Lentinula raphanica]|nr:hypothetical protein EV361DRAFT_873749 [Lentinula raphanica]